MANLPGNSREEYNKLVQWLQDHKSWGAYWAVVEDGYEDSINWKAMREKFEEEAV
jgi:hypothetical protein